MDGLSDHVVFIIMNVLALILTANSSLCCTVVWKGSFMSFKVNTDMRFKRSQSGLILSQIFCFFSMRAVQRYRYL